jgi:hypothetical protein
MWYKVSALHGCAPHYLRENNMFRQFVLAATTAALIAGPAMAQTAEAPAAAPAAPAAMAPAASPAAPAATAPEAKPATHMKAHKASHHKKAKPEAATTTKS